MIQGGGNKDGRNDPGYTIPAEILPNHFHKKGALAAARMGDQVNPQKASSGSQFYIVEGQKVDDKYLDAVSSHTGHVFTTEERETYKTIGGTPHLDGGYTVFGEVVDGFDVVDKIASVKTNGQDKPIDPVTMTITILE
jgi:peptidyl-prolyl cis-trans isomerase B (cyclophilin B)